jgi:hypothetical protein
MNNLRSKIAMALAVIVCAAWAFPAAIAQTPVLNSIFDGATLTGWNQNPAGSFEVNTTDGTIETTGSARGFLYTTATYSTYRVLYTVRQNVWLHWPTVLFFGTSDTADAMDALQFQLPKDYGWDYQTTGEYANKALPVTTYNSGPPGTEETGVWYRCEMLVNTANGSADSACAILGNTTAYHIMYFKNANVPVQDIPTPFAIQCHQTKVSDEYKDILVETNPTYNDLVLLTLPAPSAVTATAASSSQINLSWTINSTTQTGFEVFHSTDNKTWTLAGTTAASATTYSDTKLNASTTYYYRVAAILTNAISDYATATATTSAGSTYLIANGTYVIKNVYSGLALSDPGSSDANSTDMEQLTVTNGTNQQWTVNNLGNNVITLKNGASGQMLDVTGDSKAIKALVDQYPANGATNQQWQVISLGSGEYELTSVNSGLALNIVGGVKTSGADIDQYTYQGSAWQMWEFVAP